MKDLIKKLLRPLLYLILSVYVLSIPIGNKTLFFYSHRFLVENQVVSMLEYHASVLYDQLSQKIRLALVETASPKDKPSH